MHACTPASAQLSSVPSVGRTMADWSMMDREWPPDGSYDPYAYVMNEFYQEYQEKPPPPLAEFFAPQAQQYNVQLPLPLSPGFSMLESPSQQMQQDQEQRFEQQPFQQQMGQQYQPMPHQVQRLPSPPLFTEFVPIVPRGENPREIRNKAEKQRRDKLNHSISELAAMVPPVVAANKKIDKTGVLRLTAHYLRAHQYVFGDTVKTNGREFSVGATRALLSMLNGFLLTTTYKGLVVVVSQNVQQYLGYTELDLLGQNILNYIHQDDRQIYQDNLTPKIPVLGPNGELVVPEEPDGTQKVARLLAKEKRRFLVRFKKHTQRSEPPVYISCYVEGTLRKSDKASRVSSRGHIVRRARARADNPCSSGNDIVFIGVVRPAVSETFVTEKRIEAYNMEYRTRHSVDGKIMECEQRISLVAGYMTHEVNGVNAMNFLHRDDVRWVIFVLREMYDEHRLFGESCYRLMAKSGQFIYMKTRGVLDVDEKTRAVRSFVCTNTVVDEEEGKYLIKMMKKRCMFIINNKKQLKAPTVEDIQDDPKPQTADTEDDTLPVQDLEKEILHLVGNLPSPQPEQSRNSPDRSESINIIPPQKENIISAIEKITEVIKKTQRVTRETGDMTNNSKCDRSEGNTSKSKAALSPSRNFVRDRLHLANQRNPEDRRLKDELSAPFNAPLPTLAFYVMPNRFVTVEMDTVVEGDAMTTTENGAVASTSVQDRSPEPIVSQVGPSTEFSTAHATEDSAEKNDKGTSIYIVDPQAQTTGIISLMSDEPFANITVDAEDTVVSLESIEPSLNDLNWMEE